MKRITISFLAVLLTAVVASAQFVVEKTTGETKTLQQTLEFMQDGTNDNWSPATGTAYDADFDLSNLSAIYMDKYDLKLNIEVKGEVAHSGASFEIKASDENAYYFCIIGVSDIDLAYTGRYSYIPEGTSDSDLVSSFVTKVESNASNYGVTFSEMLAQMAQEGSSVMKGSQEKYSIVNLPAGRDFTLYVVGVDDLGRQKSQLQRYKFTTKPVELIDCTFDVKATIDTREVTFDIKPSDKNTYWYFGTIDAERWDAYTMYFRDDIPGFVASEVITDILNLKWTNSDLTDKECFEQVCHKGDLLNYKKTFDYTEKDYMYYVAAVSSEEFDGTFNVFGISKEAKVETFTMGKSAQVDMTFAITASATSPETATVKVVPSTDEHSYVFDCVPLARWKNMTDEQRQKSWTTRRAAFFNEGIDVYKGTQEKSDFELYPNTEYIAFAYGYGDRSTTTPFFSTTFSTPAIPAEPAFNIDVEIKNVEYTNVGIKFTPNRNDVYYCVGVVPEASFNKSACKQAIEDDIAYTSVYMVDDSYNYDNYVIAEDVKSLCRRGVLDADYIYSITGDARLQSNTDYLVYWFAVNTDTGKCEEFGSSKFSTPKMHGGKATVDVNVGKFYNSKEAYDQVDSEMFNPNPDYVVFPIEFVGKSDDAVEVWFGFSGGANFGMVDDDWIFEQGYIRSQWVDTSKVMYRSNEYNDMAWFFFAAKDKDGTFGPITRIYVDTLKENESPIEELKAFYEAHK